MPADSSQLTTPHRVDSARLTVAVLPPTSSHASQIRNVARTMGIDFLREPPADVALQPGQMLVVDTTLHPSRPPLGPNVIAISEHPDLECFDVIAPSLVRARLHRVLRNLADRERLQLRIQAERQTILALNEIGYALSSETSRAGLLDAVLTQARNVLHADGGSIYLVDGERLRFTTSQNDTIPFRASRNELPLDRTSLAGFVASEIATLNIPDVRALPSNAPYRPNLSFDDETGYRTRSMLLVPMCDHEGEVIGVLALVNRKPKPSLPLVNFSQVTSFSDRDAGIARSIASQAAVAIENHRLYRNIQRLFDGFVHAAIHAIESRDPSTAGHSHRVAALTKALALAVAASDEAPFQDVRFSKEQITELEYAAMLHDFGKVGVRESVLLKPEKLHAWELRDIEYRFRLATMQTLLAEAHGNLSPRETTDQLKQLQLDLRLIRRINGPLEELTEATRAELEELKVRWSLHDTGEPILSDREFLRLTIPYGTLDAQERLEIQRHVTHSYEFLRRIPWTRALRSIPDIAYAHHEKLNGSGYPRSLTDLDIPFGAKLMTIADIFDALTAGDRPYKPAMLPMTAVTILRHMAGRGMLVSAAVELFATARLWEGLPDHLRPRYTADESSAL